MQALSHIQLIQQQQHEQPHSSQLQPQTHAPQSDKGKLQQELPSHSQPKSAHPEGKVIT